MLENKKFMEWANENLIVVVGHTEKEHPAEVEDEKGEKTPGCSLYPGLTCEQHQAITGQCMAGGEGLPKIDVANTMPNSWLVSPGGEVVKIEPADQQSAGKIEELATEMQKAAGKHVPFKKYEKYLEDFDATDKAVEAGELKYAVKAIQKVEKDAKKFPEGMVAEVDKRIDAINAKAGEAFEAIKGDEDVAAGIKAANKLKTDVGARFKRGYLPVVEEIKIWLKEAKPAGK